MCLYRCDMKTPTDTATAIGVSLCHRCGIITKSGEMSCCGRGGSWFKNCGGAGNTKLHHTWYEGIQACKARSQSKTVIGQELNVAQQKDIDSSQGDGTSNYKVVIATTRTSVFTSVNTPSETAPIDTSTSTPWNTPDNIQITPSDHTLTTNTPTNTFMTSSAHTSASTSITKRGCVNLLKITVHINILFIIVLVIM